MNVGCPNCRQRLRLDDVAYGICWRCGWLLGEAVLPVPPPVEEVELDEPITLRPQAEDEVVEPPKPPCSRPKPAPEITAETTAKWAAAAQVPAGNGTAWKAERPCAFCEALFRPRFHGQIFHTRDCADLAERERQVVAGRKRRAN